jgi:hypothetical protein
MSQNDYRLSADESLMLNNLFSKYGFNDGEDPQSDAVHQAFSEYLRQKGYENTIVSTPHNRRVTSIKVGDSWYSTELLKWGTEWVLLKQDDGIETTVPSKLKTVIIEFLPTAMRMSNPS